MNNTGTKGLVAPSEELWYEIHNGLHHMTQWFALKLIQPDHLIIFDFNTTFQTKCLVNGA